MPRPRAPPRVVGTRASVNGAVVPPSMARQIFLATSSTRMFNPRLVSGMVPYDVAVASIICQALPSQ